MEITLLVLALVAWASCGFFAWHQVMRMKGGAREASAVDCIMLPIGIMLGPVAILVNWSADR